MWIFCIGASFCSIVPILCTITYLVFIIITSLNRMIYFLRMTITIQGVMMTLPQTNIFSLNTLHQRRQVSSAAVFTNNIQHLLRQFMEIVQLNKLILLHQMRHDAYLGHDRSHLKLSILHRLHINVFYDDKGASCKLSQ